MTAVSTGVLTLTDVSDGLSLQLSNSSHTVPSNDVGGAPVLTGAVSSAKVLQGGVDRTSDWQIQIVASAGITGTFTNNTYTVTGLTVETATVDFVASRFGYSDLTARFTVSRTKAGAGGINVVLSNSSHTLPATHTGVVSSYENSGTTIQVFEGTVALNAASATTNTGSFTIGTPVVSPSGKLTVGGRSYAGTTATVAVHSAMDAATDSVSVTFPVSIKRRNGTTLTVNAVQSISKAKQGTPSTEPGPVGPRGTVQVYRAISGSVWLDSEADAALAGSPYNGKIIADRVTLYNSSLKWSETRVWTGTAWEVLGEVIDGNLLVTGSVTARAINTNDLFAQRITLPDGGVIRAGTTTYAEMGGDGYFTAQTESGPIFKIGKDNDHFINGQHIYRTLSWEAFDGSVIPHIREQLALGTPSAGGSAAGSGALTSAGVTVTTTGSIPSAGANSAITVATSYGGYSTRLTGGEVGPQIPQVSVQLYRIVNDGTPVAIGSLTTKSGTVGYAEPIGSGVYQWTVRVPGFNVSMSDASPGVGNIKYQAVVTIANPPTNQLGTVSLSANQAATGVVSGTVSWSSIPDKPNLSLVGHTHSAAEIPGVVVTTGDQSIGGVKLFTGEVRSSSANTYRAVQGNYGVFFRNDGTTFYIMKTASGDPYGGWDSTRPFMLNLSTGIASINGNAATATTSGSISGFNNPTIAATANTIAYRDGSADVNARLFRSNYGDQTSISGAMAFRINNSSDNYIRFCSNTAAIRTWMGSDNASNLTLGTLADARLPGIFSKKTILKDAIGTGSGDYHLELRSSDVGGSGDVALMFHQANRWYHSIRANANGFRFTNGGSNNLERLTAGAYYFGDNGGHMGAGAGSSMRVQTTTGYVDVGSTNAGWTHFSTDRPAYYFNRSIHVDGEFQIYNTGSGLNSSGLFWDSGATTLYKLGTGAISIGTTNAGAVDKMLHFGYTPIDGYGFRFLHQGHASNAAAGTFSLQRGLVNSWANVLTVDNGGTLAINNMQVRLRAVTDSHHYLAYVNVAAGGWIVDGPELVGSSGGRLGTSDGNSALYWGKNKRVYLNEWLEFTSGGHIGLYWPSHGSQLQCEGGGRYTFQGGSDIGIHLSDGSGNKQGIIYAAGRNVGFLIPDLVGWALRVDAGGNAYANDFIATSDRRIKSELEVIPNALDKVSKMTGYTYMKKGNDTRRQAGYIAQDLQAVLPEGVFEYDDVLQVSHSATIGLLLNAVNELSAEVKELKRRLH